MTTPNGPAVKSRFFVSSSVKVSQSANDGEPTFQAVPSVSHQQSSESPPTRQPSPTTGQATLLSGEDWEEAVTVVDPAVDTPSDAGPDTTLAVDALFFSPVKAMSETGFSHISSPAPTHQYAKIESPTFTPPTARCDSPEIIDLSSPRPTAAGPKQDNQDTIDAPALSSPQTSAHVAAPVMIRSPQPKKHISRAIAGKERDSAAQDNTIQASRGGFDAAEGPPDKRRCASPEDDCDADLQSDDLFAATQRRPASKAARIERRNAKVVNKRRPRGPLQVEEEDEPHMDLGKVKALTAAWAERFSNPGGNPSLRLDASTSSRKENVGEAVSHSFTPFPCINMSVLD